VTRRRGQGSTWGSRRCGAGRVAASFGRKPYGAAAARAQHPGDRPRAVPAVSRCRARQHHDQAEDIAPAALTAVNVSQDRTGAPRVVRAGPSIVKALPPVA